MAAMLKRIGLFYRSNISSSLVIHNLKRLAPCGILSPSNRTSYSTESALSETEEFSLRYLEGKHEGKILLLFKAVRVF